MIRYSYRFKKNTNLVENLKEMN